MEVYKAIAAVSQELAATGIGKTRKNQQQGYSFRGIDEVLNALAPLLPKHGLLVLPRMVSRSMTERQSNKGGVLFSVVVEAEFDFVAVADGSVHVVRTYGEAMDSADKATNKAMSVAYKYSVFLTFCVPVEAMAEDADAVTHEVVPVFDEAGYQAWLALLEQSAIEGGFDSLTAEAKAGKPEYQDRLRADKATWARLKGKVSAS